MLIDTNIFLEVQLNQERAAQATKILEAISVNKVKGFITDYTIDSVIIIMENYDKSPDEIKRFLLSLLGYKGLEFYHLSIYDKIEATEHMKLLNLDFDDACMFQAMNVLKVDQIASFDTDFDKIPEIKRITAI